MLLQQKQKRLEAVACIGKEEGRLLAGEKLGAVSAGCRRMQLSVAFKNVLFGSHEWSGGFSFIPP